MSARDQILELAVLVDAASARHLATALRVAGGSGLSETLAGALWVLGRTDVEPTMREVAHDLRCDPSNATLLIGRLEQRGLAERFADPIDGRRRIVRLTAAGLALARAMADAVAADSPFAVLSDSQRSALMAMLTSEAAPARADHEPTRRGADLPHAAQETPPGMETDRPTTG